MLDVITILVYLLFAGATAALVWANRELRRSAEPRRGAAAGVNPHSIRF